MAAARNIGNPCVTAAYRLGDAFKAWLLPAHTKSLKPPTAVQVGVFAADQMVNSVTVLAAIFAAGAVSGRNTDVSDQALGVLFQLAG